eukprot:31094-Pelagococcus_subviridis.AAC.3
MAEFLMNGSLMMLSNSGPFRTSVRRGGVQRRQFKLKGVEVCASGLKARDPGRRETPGKVLKERRSPRERGRMGASVT